jgi:hypothetical protein
VWMATSFRSAAFVQSARTSMPPSQTPPLKVCGALRPRHQTCHSIASSTTRRAARDLGLCSFKRRRQICSRGQHCRLSGWKVATASGCGFPKALSCQQGHAPVHTLADYRHRSGSILLPATVKLQLLKPPLQWRSARSTPRSEAQHGRLLYHHCRPSTTARLPHRRPKQ